MRYASLREPTLLPVAQRVLAIPVKRFDRPVLGYLSRDEMAAIIDAPDRSTWSGQRDAVLFAVLYNTGATDRLLDFLEAPPNRRCSAASPRCDVQAHAMAQPDAVVTGRGSDVLFTLARVWRHAPAEPDRIVWGMDSERETSYLQIFDRRTAALTRGRAFPGPVWYGKRLAAGPALVQTTVEIGAGVRRAQTCIFASSDLVEWREIACFDKDVWPLRWCRFGVVAFADGHQTAEDFVLFGDALKGLDGQAYRARLAS